MNIGTWLHRLMHRSPPVPVHDDAIDDVAREAHMRLLNCSFEQLGESPPAALMKMVANVARERHERPTDPSLEWSGPADLTDARLRQVINAMPARRRAMVLMHAQEGLTFRQVAKRIGVSDDIALREIRSAYSALLKVLPR